MAHLQAAAVAPTSQAKSEAKLCLEMPAPPLETDVLEWWALDEMKFPALSVMVRQYLGVPATSASAECLSSIAGRAYDDLRQKMKEEMLEMMMWARVNREKRHAKRSSWDIDGPQWGQPSIDPQRILRLDRAPPRPRSRTTFEPRGGWHRKSSYCFPDLRQSPLVHGALGGSEQAERKSEKEEES
jgi:hypothetical protein